MRPLLITAGVALLLGCGGGLAGTYKHHQKGLLRKELTLFPDSTYHYLWWTDIPMSEAGRWSLSGDTLRLLRPARPAKQWLVHGPQLRIIDANGTNEWEFRKRSARCDTLFWPQ